MNKKLILSAVVCVATLIGCAPSKLVFSHRVEIPYVSAKEASDGQQTSQSPTTEVLTGPHKAKATEAVEGVAYALPLGQVQVTAERAKITKDDVKKLEAVIAELTAKKDAAKNTLEAAKKAKEEAEGAAATDPSNQELATKAKAAIAIAKFWEGVFAGHELALKESEKKLQVLRGNVDKWKESITFKQLPVTPDPGARYVARFQHDRKRDDEFKLSTTNGMLSTSNSTSTDRTLDIVEAVATAAAQFGVQMPFMQKTTKSMYFPAQSEKKGEEEPPLECLPYRATRVLNPTSAAEVEEFSSYLNRLQSAYRLSVEKSAANRTSSHSAEAADGDGTGVQNTSRGNKSANPPPTGDSPPELPDYGDGVIYRNLTTATLLAEPNATELPALHRETNCTYEALPEVTEFSVIVPDTVVAYLASPKGTPFTKSSMMYTFKDGSLIDSSEVSPSEIAAIAGLPVRIVRSMLTAVTDIVRLRVDYDSQQNELIKAQSARVTELIKLHEENERLKKALSGALTEQVEEPQP